MNDDGRGVLGGFVLLAAVAAGAVSAPAPAGEIPAAVAQAEQQRIAVMARAARAAVSVFAADGQGGGSGVVISPDGYALTNFHVVAPVGDYMQCGMDDGRLYDAVVVSLDPTGDVALIKLFGRDDFPAAELGDSDSVRAGDWCFAVGNPFLLATDLQPSLSYGLVSGVHRYQYPAGSILEYADCLQTDAAINPGNSGGPLFNTAGQLIGVNGRCSFEKRGRVNVGVGYAISINQIKKFLGHLRSGRIVDHATLGATVDRQADGKTVVSNILESSDAFRRGLRYGDEVVAFGGRAIGSVNEFKNILGTFPQGWRVPLSYRRDGTRHDILVRLAGAHTRKELLDSVQRGVPEGELPPEKRPREEGKQEPPPPHGRSGPGSPAIPEKFAPFVQPRPGYANYYFNQLERDRVWNAAKAQGDFAGLRNPWTLRGKFAGGGEAVVVLGDDSTSANLAGENVALAQDEDLGEQLAPEGSGGLLAALHVWRRLLVRGPEQFGEVYYLGTSPLAGQDALSDVLVGVFDVVETHFYFAPDSGRLAAVEMFPDENVDPCELSLLDYRELSPGRFFPMRLVVRHGDQTYAEIQWDQIDLPQVGGGGA